MSEAKALIASGAGVIVALAARHLITIAEAAKLLGVNETWIYRHRNTLFFVKKDMRPLRCSFLKLQQYIRESD